VVQGTYLGPGSSCSGTTVVGANFNNYGGNYGNGHYPPVTAPGGVCASISPCCRINSEGEGFCQTNTPIEACEFQGGTALTSGFGNTCPATGTLSECSCCIDVAVQCVNSGPASSASSSSGNMFDHFFGVETAGASRGRESLAEMCEIGCDQQRCANSTFRITITNSCNRNVPVLIEDTASGLYIHAYIKPLGNFTKDVSVFIGCDTEEVVTVTSQAGQTSPLEDQTCVATDSASFVVTHEKSSGTPFEPIRMPVNSGSASAGLPPPAPWQRQPGQMFPRWP